MFIDIHAHIMRADGPALGGRRPFSLAEELIARFDAVGIEKAVLLPLASPEIAPGVTTVEEVLAVSRQYPDRFIPFCSVDPRSMYNTPDAPLGDLLGYYRDLGAKGLGELIANLPFSDPRVQNLFHHLEALDMPVTFHIATQLGGMYGLQDDPGLPQLEATLQRFPRLKFFGHSQAFWSEIGQLENPGDRGGYPRYPIKEEGAVIRLMRAYSNLYGDLSAGSGCNALARDLDFAVNFLNEFQDRLFFGTDICAPDTPTPLVDLMLKLRDEGKISVEVFEKVAKGNAERVLVV